MQTVTPRQLQVLRFIRDFRASRGYSPTMQEIGNHLGLTKVTVFEHIRALEGKSLVLRGAKHKARSLRVSPKFEFADEGAGRILLAGTIAAGQPIEAIEDRQNLDLERMFGTTGETFALRVNGDSMIDEQIRDGDYVLCQRRDKVHNGETVVALLTDGEATLKKFYNENGRIRLQPANPEFQPIYPDNIDIQGVVVGVIRKI